MARKYTQAQNKATKKYFEKLESISIRVKPEEADRYRDAAKKCGLPLRQFLLAAMDEKIDREALGPDTNNKGEKNDEKDGH